MLHHTKRAVVLSSDDNIDKYVRVVSSYYVDATNEERVS